MCELNANGCERHGFSAFLCLSNIILSLSFPLPLFNMTLKTFSGSKVIIYYLQTPEKFIDGLIDACLFHSINNNRLLSIELSIYLTNFWRLQQFGCIVEATQKRAREQICDNVILWILISLCLDLNGIIFYKNMNDSNVLKCFSHTHTHSIKQSNYTKGDCMQHTDF